MKASTESKLTREEQLFEETNINLFKHGRLSFKYKEKLTFDANKDLLSKATRTNLWHLEKLNIRWKEIYIQKVFRLDCSKSFMPKIFKQATSYLITGHNGPDELFYLRKETQSPQAGQTSLYLNDDKIQMTSILSMVREDVLDWVKRATITKAESLTKEDGFNKNRVLSEQWVKFLGSNLYQTKQDATVEMFNDNNTIREIATSRIKKV